MVLSRPCIEPCLTLTHSLTQPPPPPIVRVSHPELGFDKARLIVGIGVPKLGDGVTLPGQRPTFILLGIFTMVLRHIRGRSMRFQSLGS